MAIQKSDGMDAYNNFPSKFITVYSTTAVAVGDVVEIDFSATRSPLQGTDAFGFSVKKATASANNPMACGVATQTIAAANYVQIQYAGYNAGCLCEAAGGITLGQFVGTDDTASGRVQPFSGNRTATSDYFAVCVDAFTASTVDGAVIIFDKGFFNA